MEVSAVEIPFVPLHRVDTLNNLSFYTTSVAQDISPQLHRMACIVILYHQWFKTTAYFMTMSLKGAPLFQLKAPYLVEGIVRIYAKGVQYAIFEACDGVIEH